MDDTYAVTFDNERQAEQAAIVEPASCHLDMTETISNSASFVGRYISFVSAEGTKRDAIIVAYDPDTHEHAVECRDGTEMTFVLAKQQFKWLVTKCEPAESRHVLLARAVRRDAVGRKLKVYNKAREKWYNGEIVAFNDETGRHSIRFEEVKNDKELNLDKRKWRYTDLIGNRSSHSSNQSIASSKFAGVQRSSVSTWIAFGGSQIGTYYVGTFKNEKDAALAHDVYARKDGRSDINFPHVELTECDIEKRRQKQYSDQAGPLTGKSKYRGVHWQKNRKRWMARYTLAHTGEKNINLGAFSEARHAGLAFDAEARKRHRPEKDLNFPDEHPTDEQIESWKSNTSHYTVMGSRNKSTSQYRGISKTRKSKGFHVQININKILEAYGTKRGPLYFGSYMDERQAALVYDRICRSHGIPEKELNFPRDQPNQKQVRLFDDECYFCRKENPTDPVATPCHHVFCRDCIENHLATLDNCPSCHTNPMHVRDLRPVQLIPWPKENALTTRRRKRKESRTAGTAKSPKQDNAEEEAPVEEDELTSDLDGKKQVAKMKSDSSGPPQHRLPKSERNNETTCDEVGLHDDGGVSTGSDAKVKKQRLKSELSDDTQSDSEGVAAKSEGGLNGLPRQRRKTTSDNEKNETDESRLHDEGSVSATSQRKKCRLKSEFESDRSESGGSDVAETEGGLSGLRRQPLKSNPDDEDNVSCEAELGREGGSNGRKRRLKSELHSDTGSAHDDTKSIRQSKGLAEQIPWNSELSDQINMSDVVWSGKRRVKSEFENDTGPGRGRAKYLIGTQFRKVSWIHCDSYARIVLNHAA